MDAACSPQVKNDWFSQLIFLPWNQGFGFYIFAQVWAISFKYFFAASRGVAPSVNVTSNLHNRGYE